MGLRIHTLPEYSQATDKNQATILLASYISLTGSEQYWDFFAPAPYTDYQSLLVCDAIHFSNNQQVDCTGNILYQSYDGNLKQIFRDFGGNRSRSYRFTEQFIALDNTAVYEQFLRYWHEQSKLPKTDFLYLISQNHVIKPTKDQPKKVNKILWVIER